MSFIDGIKAKARANKKTIVLPESEDERVIRAAAEAVKEDLANIIVLGDPNVANADAAKYGVSLEGVTVINPETSDKPIRNARANGKWRIQTEQKRRRIADIQNQWKYVKEFVRFIVLN